MSEETLTITFDTDEPIPLESFTQSLSALKREYESVTQNSSNLLVKEVRKGSFEIDFIAVLIGTQVLPLMNGVNSFTQFFEYVKTTSSWLLGKSEKSKEIKYSMDELKDFKELFQPVIQVADVQAKVVVSNANSEPLVLTKPDIRQISDAVDSRVQIKEETPTVEDEGERFYNKVLFYWYQACFDPKKINTGNKGTIASIDENPKKVIFLDDDSDTKREMTEIHPEIGVDWQNIGYIVDVEILYSAGKVKAYKILKNYLEDAILD